MKIITICSLAVAAVAAGCCSTGNSVCGREPVKIILDTDMISDYDDMGAMACLHAMADAGECEILATVSCTRDNGSVAAVEICNTYYGRGDIPVGRICRSPSTAQRKRLPWRCSRRNRR